MTINEWLKNSIQQEMFPNIYAFIVEKKIRSRYSAFKDRSLSLRLNTRRKESISKSLLSYHEREAERKKIIEEKGRAALFIVALSITIGLATLGLLKDLQNNWLSIVAFCFFSIGLLYLLIAGITALRVVNIGEFHQITISDELEERKDVITESRASKQVMILKLYRYLKLNQHINNIKANFAYATFIGIRNGIVLIAMFFFLILIGRPIVRHHENKQNFLDARFNIPLKDTIVQFPKTTKYILKNDSKKIKDTTSISH